jgi:hypothetical protein
MWRQASKFVRGHPELFGSGEVVYEAYGLLTMSAELDFVRPKGKDGMYMFEKIILRSLHLYSGGFVS